MCLPALLVLVNKKNKLGIDNAYKYLCHTCQAKSPPLHFDTTFVFITSPHLNQTRQAHVCRGVSPFEKIHDFRCNRPIQFRGAQYQYFIINSISIILVSFLSIPISISIILKRAYQYQYLINFSKSSFINFNINLLYQCPTMILIRLPISYQLVIVLNINIDIN